MKKIALWKMILLSIVTLGLYQFYWLAVQKKHLEKLTKTKLPSTGWLISSAVTIFVSYALIAVLWIIPDSEWVAILLLFSLIGLILTYAGLVMLWWIIVFLRAADQLLSPRVTFTWMLVHLFTLGLEMFIAQYYFNREAKRGQKKPSRRFVTVSLTLIISFYVIITAGVATLVIIAGNLEGSFEDQNRTAENTELNELGKKSVLLSKKYDGCIETLDKQYPVVTDETEDAYLDGYDDCEEIRLEQNDIAEQYRNLELRLLNE